MAGEPQQRARVGLDVGVDEGDIRRADPSQPCVAGPGRAEVLRQGQHAGAVARRDRGHGSRVVRGVVDHEHPQPGQRQQRALELLRSVAHRHHHGEIVRRDGRAVEHRVGEVGVEQPAGQLLRCRVVDHQPVTVE